MGYRGYGHMGNEAHWGYGVQGYMGHMGNRGTGVWGTRGMGHMGNGSHGQWGTGVWAMGPMGNLHPKCQKAVKLSKKCQMSKNQTPRL